MGTRSVTLFILGLASVAGTGQTTVYPPISPPGAPLSSPALSGIPTAPTPTAGDSSTKLATTAFVAGAVSGSTGGASCAIAAPYSGSVTYKSCDLAQDASGDTYQSLVSSNTGNALPVFPTRSNSYWILTGNNSSPLFKTNGNVDSSQTTRNLVNSATVTFSTDGSGNTTATAAGGGSQFTANGAASTPAATISGVPFTGGTSTTTSPLWLFQPSGVAAETSWNTGGTLLGFNLGGTPGATMAIDVHSYGHSVFSVDNAGDLLAGSANIASLAFNSFGSSGNCSSSASPAVCGNNAAGSVTIAAGATTKVVNDSLVSANSQISITFDASLGTKLGVTCNATYAPPYVSARTAGTGFTISTTAAPATSPACYSFVVMN